MLQKCLQFTGKNSDPQWAQKAWDAGCRSLEAVGHIPKTVFIGDTEQAQLGHSSLLVLHSICLTDVLTCCWVPLPDWVMNTALSSDALIHVVQH